MADEQDICFVISPIGEEDSDTRDRANNLFNHVIEPAVEPYGYRPVRADHIAEPGMITNQIIEHVVESPLVIADLAESNANVFYELAVRHAIREPYIQIIPTEETIPFDVAGTRTINIDLQDLGSVAEAKNEIGRQIENIEPDGQQYETPISVALDLQNLRESSDPEERSIAELMENLSEIRTSINKLENIVNDPAKLIPPNYIRQVTSTRETALSDEAVRDLNHIDHNIRRLLQFLNEDPEIDIENINDELSRVQHRVSRLRHSVERGQAGLDEFD